MWFPVLLALGPLCTRVITTNGRTSVLVGMAFVIGAFLIEINNTVVVGYSRSLLAEPSIGLVLLCIHYVGKPLNKDFVARNQAMVLTSLFLLGGILYPMALGLGWFDPYAWGYHPSFALILLFVASLSWWFPKVRIVALWASLALFAFGWQLGESDNLWDYVMDPVAFLISLVWFTRQLVVTIGARIVTN